MEGREREVFGKKASKKFKIGDLAYWNKLGSDGEKHLGVIIDLFEKEIGGRPVYCADIIRVGESVPVTVPAIALKMASEIKIDEIQDN